MSGESVDHASNRRKRPREQVPLLRNLADACLERLQDLLLATRAHPGELPEPALLRRRLQPVERRDPELGPDARRRLRPHSGQAQEVDDSRGNEPTPLGERVHLAVLDNLDDLVLDRLADAGELLRLPVERELGDGQRRLPDPAGCPSVGDHLERLFLEDLGQVGEEVELVREVAVAGQRRGHPAMIRR